MCVCECVCVFVFVCVRERERERGRERGRERALFANEHCSPSLSLKVQHPQLFTDTLVNYYFLYGALKVLIFFCVLQSLAMCVLLLRMCAWVLFSPTRFLHVRLLVYRICVPHRCICLCVCVFMFECGSKPSSDFSTT